MQPDPASLHTKLQSAPGQEPTPTTLQQRSDRLCATHELEGTERERTRLRERREAVAKRLREQLEAVAKRLRELDPESLPFPPPLPFPSAM